MGWRSGGQQKAGVTRIGKQVYPIYLICGRPGRTQSPHTWWVREREQDGVHDVPWTFISFGGIMRTTSKVSGVTPVRYPFLARVKSRHVFSQPGFAQGNAACCTWEALVNHTAGLASNPGSAGRPSISLLSHRRRRLPHVAGPPYSAGIGRPRVAHSSSVVFSEREPATRTLEMPRRLPPPHSPAR